MRPKDIGTRAETAVVRYLREHGFAHAERRALHGNVDLGDITGTPGIAWEVKGGDAARNASDGQITAWLTQANVEAVNSSSDVGILVVQRWRKNPSDWWAITTITDWLTLLGVPDISELYVSPTSARPARITLADITCILRHAGYGDPSPCQSLLEAS